MNIADGAVAQEFVQPFQRFADDGGTQVADVQRLGDVGSAVVHHHRLSCTGFLYAEVFGIAHFFQVSLQEAAGHLQVNEARHNRFYHIVVIGIQLFHNALGDLDGGALVLLGGRQGAVALVFAQVGPVGHGDPAERSVIAGIGECLLHLFGDDV